MIVDAPLKFSPNSPYYILDESPVSVKLQYILQKFYPENEFRGFVDDPVLAMDAKLVVCEMATPAARELIERREAEEIILFPVPVEDAWSYWDFADFAPDLMPLGSPNSPRQGELLNMLAEIGEIKFDKGDRSKITFSNAGYLYYHPDVLEPYQNLIDTVREGLSDETSKRLYEQIIKGTPLDQINHYAEQVFGTVQYFERLNYGVCNTVLNGGVFEGFELPFLSMKLPRNAVVHNIDPLGHDHLSDYSRQWLEAAQIDWREHRLALARQPGDVVMGELESEQLTSSMSESDDKNKLRTVPGTSVDALVAHENISKVDLIKFDLEGGDAEAWAGAVNTIKRDRPQIAASIYHYVNDFWRIPELMMRICEDYSFYLGAYSRQRWETILYAVPNEVRSESR